MEDRVAGADPLAPTASMTVQERSRRFRIRLLSLLAACFVAGAGCSVGARPAGAIPAPIVEGPVRVQRPGVVYREHRVAGLRVYEVVIGRVDFDSELPLVVQIHGRGDRARVPQGYFGGVTTPIRLILPEAPDPFRDGYTWSPVSVTQGRHRELSDALRENANRIAYVMRYFRGIRAVRGEPIVTGFSQGGMLAFTLAVLHPDDVGVSFPVAGWLPPQLMPRHVEDPESFPAIHAIHGTVDPVVKLGPTRRTVRRLHALGIDCDLREVEGVRHAVTPEVRATLSALLREAIAALGDA
ncbi:MAG: hypothetical protein U0230_13475 [Polyangiales bacterium]